MELKEFGDLRFRHPATICVCGSSSSGKSTFVHHMLDNIDYVLDKTPTKIFYIYSHWQKPFELLEQSGKVTFFQGWDHPELQSPEEHKGSMWILDDVADTIKDPDWLRNFYCKKSHHLEITILTILHNIFSRAIPHLREISLNCQITVFLASPRALDSISTFSHQVFKDKAKAFLQVYRKVCEEKPYGYCLVDASPLCPPQLRIRTNIFEFEKPLTVYIPI